MHSQQNPSDCQTSLCEVPPRVSIGMPVFNGEAFLPQAIACLLAQTFTDFELIISDNASTDDTGKIAQAFASQDSRIIYLRNSENIGVFKNYNQVFEASRGEFFMWAAHDDLWEPEFIEELLGLLEKSPDAILAFCCFDNIDSNAIPLKHYDLSDLVTKRRIRALHRYLLHDERLGKSNLVYGLIRREELQIAQGFHKWSGRLWGADMLIVFRLFLLGRLQVSDRYLFHKRLDQRNQTECISNHKNKIATHREHLQENKHYLSTYRRMIDDYSNLSGFLKWSLRLTVTWCEHKYQLKTFRDIFHEYRKIIKGKIFRGGTPVPGLSGGECTNAESD